MSRPRVGVLGRGVLVGITLLGGPAAWGQTDPPARQVWQPGAVVRAEPRSVLSVSVAPDGRTLASSGFGKTIRLADPTTLEEVGTLHGHEETVTAVAFPPDGRSLVSASKDGSARVWDLATRTSRLVLAGHGGSVRGLAIAPDGRTIATGGLGPTRLVGEILLWNAGNGEPIAPAPDYRSGIYVLEFAPDGKILASGAADATVQLWDVATGRSIGSFDGFNVLVNRLAFAPDGKTFIASGGDLSVRVFDLATREQKHKIPLQGRFGASIAFAPGGATFAYTDRGRITLADSRSCATVAVIPLEPTLDLGSVAFTPDGRGLIAAGMDVKLRRFDRIE